MTRAWLLPAVAPLLFFAILAEAGSIQASSARACTFTGVRVLTVRDATGADELAQQVWCEGGFFNVEWHESVVLPKSLEIGAGTTLNITGKGADTSILDGGGERRHIRVKRGASVNLKDLALVGGKNVGGGGSIYGDEGSHIRVDSCEISGNTARRGGGIYSAGHPGVETTVILAGSTQIFSNSVEEKGGGLYVSTASLVLQDEAKCHRNEAGGDAGCAYVHGLASVNMFNNSIVSFNTAKLRGGGLLIEHASRAQLWNKAQITENEAGTKGGGLLVNVDSSLEMHDLAFLAGNQAGVRGGGVEIEMSSQLVLTGSAAITDNVSEGEGGGLYLRVESNAVLKDVAVIEGNVATGSGGNAQGEAHSTLTLEGGAKVQGSEDLATGDGLVVMDRTSKYTDPLNEAAAALPTPVMVPSFPCEQKGADARKISVQEDARSLAYDVMCEGGTFNVTWSSSVKLARPIEIGNGTSLIIRGSGSSSLIDGGSTMQLFVVRSNARLTLQDVGLVNGFAEGLGGSIFAHPGASVHCDGCSIHGSAALRGGAAYLSANSTMSIMGGSQISGNKADISGGGIYVEGAQLRVGGTSRIESNTAGSEGGAIFANYGASVATEEQSIISENSATRGGGVMATVKSSFAMKDKSTLEGNSAAQEGGGVMIDLGSHFLVSGESGLVRNTAMAGGGASIEHGSAAIIGGAVSVESNSAEEDGGGLFIHSSTLDIGGEAAVNGNRAKYGGGCFLELSSSLNMTGASVMKYNEAADGGAGLYSLGSVSILASISMINANKDDKGLASDTFYDDVSILTLASSGSPSAEQPPGAIDSTPDAPAASSTPSPTPAPSDPSRSPPASSEHTPEVGQYEVPCPFTGVRALKVRDVAGADDLAQQVWCEGGSFEVDWLERIVLPKSLEIGAGTTLNITGRGVNASILDGGGERRHIRVKRGASVHLRDLALVGGKNQGGGGSIYGDEGSFIHVDSCEISGNVARRGGGIYSAGHPGVETTVILAGSTQIVSNSVEEKGGGMYISTALLVLQDETKCHGNRAGGDAGCAYVHGLASVQMFHSSAISSNTAKIRGGGLLVEHDSHAYLWNEAEITENEAGTVGGGVLINVGSTMEVHDSALLARNTAAVRGGGVGVENRSQLTMKDKSRITDNVSKGNGGGMYLKMESTTLIGDDVQIEGNEAQEAGSGAAVDVYSALTLEGNAQLQGDKGYSDEIGAAKDIAVDDTSSFRDPQSPSVEIAENGTASSPYIVGPCAVSNFHLVGTPAEADALRAAVGCNGGNFDVVWTSSVKLESPIEVGNGTSLIIRGSGKGSSVIDGGGSAQLFVVGPTGSLTLKDVGLVNGFAGKKNGLGLGGSVFAHPGASLICDGCSISGSVAFRGGAVYLSPGSRMTTLGDASIGSNKADTNGGGIFVDEEAELRVGGSTQIHSNTAASEGGGVYAQSRAVIIMDNESIMSKNQATRGGGVMAAFFSSLEMKDKSRLEDNKSVEEGGGAMIDIGASLIMEGESALLRNTGQLGAGACVSHGSKATLSGSSRVEENTADDDGGGLYMHSSILAIAGEVTLRKNNAFFGGGVFLELSSPLDMTGTSTISENVAGTAGGGVYNLACRTNIGPTSTISGNTAREQPDTGDIFNDDIAVSLAVGVKLVKPEVPTPPPTPSPESDGDEVPMVQMDASFEGEDADTFTGVELEAFKVAVTNVCGSVPVVVSLVRRLAERSKWRRLSAVLTFQIEESSAEELIAAAESGLLLDEYKAALAEARVPADSINVMAITVTNTPDDPAAESSDNVIALDTLSAILISLIILLIVWVAALMYCRLRKRNQQDQTSCFVSDAVSCCSMFRKRSPPLDADHAEVSIPIKDIDKSCIEKEYSALEAPAFGTPMSVSQRTQKSQPSRVSSCQTADMLATALVHMGTNSAIPGIPEVSTLIQVIIRTIKQDDSNRDEQQSTIRWCQNMARTLSCIQEYVENKQLSESSKVVEALFIEIGDVKFKLEELLEVLESYQRMGRVKQFFQSTLTAARKDEAKSLLQDSLTRLQLGLITSIALDEQQRFQQLNEKLAPSTDDATRDTILSNHFSAQALRRKRKEDMFGELEIPASDVLIADAIEQGTISTLHLADYKGRNAIAKVFGTHVTGMFGKVKMDKLRKLFANELHIMRTLRHENVLNVYGAMTSQPDQLVLIMEFTSRGNMREFMDEKSGGNLTPELARKWMIQVSRSLAYAHSKGVIHRDLKSPIILLDSELNCKISDFGLSRITDTITSLSTVGSTWGGSTAWSAPEVLERSLRSQAGDIYSLGVVIWECLTAKEPWSEEGFNGSAIYGAVVQRRERLLVPNGTPSGMRLLVSQCFAHAASERPSAHEIAHALEMGSWMGDELFH